MLFNNYSARNPGQKENRFFNNKLLFQKTYSFHRALGLHTILGNSSVFTENVWCMKIAWQLGIKLLKMLMKISNFR